MHDPTRVLAAIASDPIRRLDVPMRLEPVDYAIDLEHIVLASIPASLDTFEDFACHLRTICVDFNHLQNYLRLGTSISLISALIICQLPKKGTPGLRQFSRFRKTEGNSHKCLAQLYLLYKAVPTHALGRATMRIYARQRVAARSYVAACRFAL